MLSLHFPAFHKSLSYDPIVGLGVLLGKSSSPGGSGTNIALVAGIVAGVGGAIILLSAIVFLAVILGWKNRKRWISTTDSINVDMEILQR